MGRRSVLVCMALAAVLFTAPSSVEGQTCAVASVSVGLGTSSFFDPSNPRFSLHGTSIGGLPTTFTWKKDGAVLSNSSVYTISDPTIMSPMNPCEGREYRSVLTVVGRVPGVFTYTASNADTGSNMEGMFTVEGTGPPTNLVLRQSGRDSIVATWTPLVPAPARGYTVYLTEDVTAGGMSVTNPTYTESSVSVGTIVTIRVIAVSTHFRSEVLGPESITVLGLSAPVVTMSSVSTTTATIVLFQPMNSLPAQQYIVTLTRTTGPQQSLCQNVAGTMTMTTNMSDSVVVEGLEEFSLYSLSVTARHVEFDLTNVQNLPDAITTLTAVPTMAPRDLNASIINSRNVTLTWTTIDCIERNGDITDFMIQYIATGGELITTNTMSSVTNFIVPSLLPYTEYRFRVAGVNINGTGPYTTFFGPRRTAEAEPGPVSGLTGKAKFFTVELSWSPPQMPNGVITSYDITYTVNGSSSSSTASVDATSDPPTYTIPNLRPQTNISNIIVTARTSVGAGNSTEFNDTFTTISEPPMVTNVVVTVLTDTSVRVSWERLSIPEITEYIVYYIQTGNRKRQATEKAIIVSSSMNSVDITGLTSGAEYQFQVVAQATVEGEDVRGQRSMITDMTVIVVMVTTLPSEPTIAPSIGDPVGPIIGGVILAIAVVVGVVIAIFIFCMCRAGRLNFLKSKGKSAVNTGRFTSKSDFVLTDKYNSDDTAPLIEEFPENTNAIEGEGVIFKVVVSGKPTPTLTWYHNEKELSSSYALVVQDDGTLSFPTTELDQSGVYHLMAENSAGKAEMEVKLQVEKEGQESTPDHSKQSLDLKPVSMEDFGDYVAHNHSSNNRGFRDQFQALYDGDDHSKTIGLSPQYKKLNRFANITVYDDNRIELSPIPDHDDCQGQFINACYIDGFTKQKKFIASQGPIPKTLVDFWRMIWQEKPPIIVMVTNLKEGNKNKCQQYWPDTGTTHYGPFRVTLTENVILADYCIRTMQVTLEGSNRPFKLTQFHFTAWPDHGVPDYATPMLAFHRRVQSAHKGKRGPILVHCSAGVGRTGTFICIDSILEQIKKEKVIDIAGTITKMRHQRMKMVQTPEQFVFLHDAILESVRCGDTQINAANLRAFLHKYEKKDEVTGLNKFQSQFSVLEQVSPKVSDVVCTAATRNPERNRSNHYLPSDRFRVILKGEAVDYIHAVFAHGYKHQKAYIIAENPMESTVENVLRILYDRKCGAAVMLSALREDGHEVCSQYWPKLDQMKRFGEYVVDLISEEELTGFTIRNISILHERTRKAHQVMQFHITCWQPNGYCSNWKSVVDVIEEVAKVQRKTGNKPIFVHCGDTVTRSGIFCALSSIIDRCKTEGVVDVFQVVKALRVQKPGAVPTMNDYRAIFEATLTFLDSFDTYANFQS